MPVQYFRPYFGLVVKSLSMRSILLSLVFLMSLFSASVSAQETLIYEPEQRIYQAGIELFEKQNYTGAREQFENYLRNFPDGQQASNARYYAAFCALALFHNDGEKLVEEFISKNPIHPKAMMAYYELGRFYFLDKKYIKAAEYFEKVNLSRLDAAKRTEVRFKLGYAYFSLRKFDRANEYFSVIKKQEHAYTSAANYYSGYIGYESGEYARAIQDLHKAEESDAYASIVPYMVAASYYQLRQYDDLANYLKKIQAEDRGRITNEKELNLLYAEAYFQQKEYKLADEYFDLYIEDLKIRPDRSILYRSGYAKYQLKDYQGAIIPLNEAAATTDSIGYYASYYLGISYLNSGNKSYALNSFKNAGQNPYDKRLQEEAYYQYAKLAYEMSQPNITVDALEAFMDKYPNSKYAEEVNDLLSAAFLQTNNYSRAITHIEKLPKKTPAIEAAYQRATFLKGVEHFNKGEYPQAVSSFQIALKYPRDAEILTQTQFWMAEAYSVGKRHEEAAPLYQRVIGQSGDPVLQSRARYGLGYVYFNEKEYAKARVQFREFVQANQGRPQDRLYQDGRIRLADCYYVEKQYEQALEIYKYAADHYRSDQDYALLQAAIISSIRNLSGQAREYFDKVIKDFPNSRFYDEAIYQKAQMEFELGNYEQAVSGFTNLIARRPNSRFVPFALLRRASSNYNLRAYAKTIEDYKKVINEYTRHPAAKEALLPLQEALTIENKSYEFEPILAKYKESNPDKEGLEQVEFETARNAYFNQKYQDAISKFESFIRTYPGDPNVTEARFYIGESYFRLNQDEKALQFYNMVIQQKSFSMINRVTQRMVELEFRNGRYENAIFYSYKLAGIATNKREQFTAWSYLMESFYLTAKYDSVNHYAQIILEKGNVNASAENKATLFIGKAAFSKGDYETAKDEFINAVNRTRDVHGAEAQYLIGIILRNQENFRGSIESLIELNNNFSAYEDWVGKAFLLMADNYISLGEVVQARSTLQSLADNFPVEEIRIIAKTKLESLN